ncbi:MAG: M23 family metallopeptidase [Anaerolineales bacterium]|nr:M23 family metallopeptidase [Anaerolineales bacterium]MDW8446774.1 M23 family metallopeptidase [Anaerolineales bacterium]
MASTKQGSKTLGVFFINALVFIVLGIAVYLGWLRYQNQTHSAHIGGFDVSVESNSLAQQTPEPTPISLPDLPKANPSPSIVRHAVYLTIIPERSPTKVITYTVKSGDTLFTIAEKFNLKPATLLWGNYEVLQDNPHFLKPGQVLNILPVDGTYYQWQEGDTIEKVAQFFKTEPQKIIEFSGNNIDLTKIGEPNSGIEPGTWIVVPGGKRAIKDWGPPPITRKNPASARYYGSGSCGEVYEGAVGTGSFVWPTTERTISGYHYDPVVHPAIDIAGQIGNPVFAADTGVVVYSGWSDFGYGYLLVIDHGNGWQSAYAHLNSIAATCGMSVFRGGAIATLGNSGNSTGPHLHFELIYNGVKVNPLDFLN